MARNRRKRNRDERDDTPIANDRVARPAAPRDGYSWTSGPRFTDFEDRRHFHPERDPPFMSTTGAPAPFRTRDFKKTDPRKLAKRLSNRPTRGRTNYYQASTEATPIFNQPGSVLVCVRRQRRKEILHALKKTGRGGSLRRKRKLTERSYYKC